MALTINRQFDKFVEFALNGNPRGLDAIARAGDIADGGLRSVRSVKEAEGDSIGKMFRSDDLQRENNMARKLFRQSVVEIFGGESKIPQNVRDAMKLKDYDQGKPLTARRILAVKAAIEVCADRAAAALDRAKGVADADGFYTDATAHKNPEESTRIRAQINKVLTVAVNAAVSDPDALEVVVACGRAFVERTGDRVLRTEEEVKDKVAGLLANVAELREAAKGNQSVMNAGLDMLKSLRGKNLAPGIIKTIVNAVVKQSISALKALSPDSPGIDLHEAVVQLYKNASKAVSIDVLKMLGGGDDQGKVQSFCIRLMLERIGEDAARGIKTLMDAKGSLMETFYSYLAGRDVHIDGLNPVTARYLDRPALTFCDTIDRFYAELQRRLGTPADDIQMLRNVRNPNYAAIDPQDVAADVVEHAREVERTDRETYLKVSVEGSGRGADKVRGVFDAALPPRTFEPGNEFKQTVNNNTLGLVNRNLCNIRKGLVDGNPRSLAFHIPFMNGEFDVALPDGSLLERNADAAYDTLASFITNGAKPTFAGLDDGEKKKLFILLSILGSSNCHASEQGGKIALDQNGRDDGRLAVDGRYSKCKFSLSFSGNKLVVKCETEREIANLRVKNGQGAMENVAVKPRSKLVSGYALRIPLAEIDRLANLDFAAYDDAPVQQRLDDPNVERPYRNVGPSLGDGFAFDNSVTIGTEFKLTVK